MSPSRALVASLTPPALLFALLLALTSPAQAQLLPGAGDATPDSIIAEEGLPEGHSPDGALRRALMVPGWGQYYNRQYWKIPLAVAGLGGVVYALIYNWDRYYLYRNAFRYRRGEGSNPFVSPPAEGEPDPYDGDFGGGKYEDAYRTVLAQTGGEFGDDLAQNNVNAQRDQFRRWGEFAILGTGLFWLLQTADAYVSAHLLGFDADDLSMQVFPRPAGGLTGRLRLTF